MHKDEAKSLCDEAFSQLAEALSQGKSEELTKFLTTMSKFHSYSFGNCMLIARQFPSATLVAGFHAWKKLGRSVKKGQKGICILAPMVGKQEDDQGEVTKKVFGFRAVHVFDVSQTEGDELPEPNRVEGDPGVQLETLERVVFAMDIELSREHDLGGADGVSKGGKIALRSDLSAAEAFSTLAHELAHELMHRAEDRRSMPKMVKELEAESVAYVISQAAGLTGALKQSSDYIQCHKGDAEQLAKSMERIQKTSALILEKLAAEEHALCVG